MSSASSDYAIWYWPHQQKKKKGITVKMHVSGPWTATKHTNKRSLCPRPSLHVSVSNYTPSQLSKNGKLLQHNWVYRTQDRINLRSVPNIHAKQAFSIGFSQAIKFQKCGHGPHLWLKPSMKELYVFFLSDEGLLKLYQASVNWELIESSHTDPVHCWMTYNPGDIWIMLGLFGKSTTRHSHSHLGMPGEKGDWRMPAVVSGSALDIHPLSLQGS